MTILYHGNAKNWKSYSRAHMDVHHWHEDMKNHLYLTNSEVVAKDYIPKGRPLAISYDKLNQEDKAKVDAMELPAGFRFFQLIPGVMEGVAYFEITPYGDLTGKAVLAAGFGYSGDDGEIIDVPEDKLKEAAAKQLPDNRNDTYWNRYRVRYPKDDASTIGGEQLVLPYSTKIVPKNGDLLNNAKLDYYNKVHNFAKGGTLKTIEVELKNPYTIDYGGCIADWADCYTTERRNGAPAMKEALKYAMDNGHDGLIVKNVIDVAGNIFRNEDKVNDMYIVFNPDTVKVLKTEVLA